MDRLLSRAVRPFASRPTPCIAACTVAIALTSLAAGCRTPPPGGRDGPPAASSPTAVDPALPTGVAAASEVPAPIPVVLAPGIPPEGVVDLLGGALPYIFNLCRKQAEEIGADGAIPPQVVALPATAEIGTTAEICALGFPAGAVVALTVTPPGAPARTIALDIAEDPLSGTVVGQHTWVAFPGDAVGDYALAATGPDGATAEATLRVAPATMPHVVVDPAEARAGDRIRIGVSGQPAEHSLPLHVYFDAGALQWRYLTTVGPLRTDATGAASVMAELPADARATEYAIVPGDSVASYRTIVQSDFRVVP